MRKVRDGWWCSCSACFWSFFDPVMQPGQQSIPTSPFGWHPHFFADVVAFHLLSKVCSRSERMQCGVRTVPSVRPGLCRPVVRSVVPVLVLSILGSSACKKSAANRFDTREGLLVVVRKKTTRVFADGEAVARLKTKSLETVLGRTKSVRLAKQRRKFLLLSAQKIVEADPCLASIPGLLRGLGVICLFLTT